VHDKILIVDNEAISLWVYPRRKMIHHQIKAHLHGMKFRDALTRGTEALVQYKATKWLSDDRGNAAVLAEDSSWAQLDWFPRTKASGWKHWAVVQPVKVIGQINMARFITECSQAGINGRMFSDPDKAFAWLDAQD
jgi:hypothetical protein